MEKPLGKIRASCEDAMEMLKMVPGKSTHARKPSPWLPFRRRTPAPTAGSPGSTMGEVGRVRGGAGLGGGAEPGAGVLAGTEQTPPKSRSWVHTIFSNNFDLYC